MGPCLDPTLLAHKWPILFTCTIRAQVPRSLFFLRRAGMRSSRLRVQATPTRAGTVLSGLPAEVGQWQRAVCHVSGWPVMIRMCRAGKYRTVRSKVPSPRRRRQNADATAAGRASESARGGRYPREDLHWRHR